MTGADLEAIRARMDAATSGPWQSGQPSWAGAGAVLTSEGHPIAICGDGEGAAADAEFIAHARQDVYGLLAEVARLRAAIEEQGWEHAAAKTEAATLRADVARLKDTVAADCLVICGVRHLVRNFETPGDAGRTRVFVSDLRNVLDGGGR